MDLQGGPRHRMGAGRGHARVLHEPGLRARRVRIRASEEHGQHHLEELHRVRRIARSRSWSIGWGLMFGDGNAFVGLKGLFFLGGADNSPAVGDAYQGVYSAHELDRRAADGEVLLPARLRRHGGDDRLRSRGRADQVPSRSSSSRSCWSRSSTRSSVTGSGAAAGSPSSASGTSPAPRSCTRSARGRRSQACIVLGPAHRQVRQGRQGPRDSRPQHDLGDDRCAHPVARLVRLQPGQHDGRRPDRHLAHRRHHEHRGRRGCARRDGARVDACSASPTSA